MSPTGLKGPKARVFSPRSARTSRGRQPSKNLALSKSFGKSEERRVDGFAQGGVLVFVEGAVDVVAAFVAGLGGFVVAGGAEGEVHVDAVGLDDGADGVIEVEAVGADEGGEVVGEGVGGEGSGGDDDEGVGGELCDLVAEDGDVGVVCEGLCDEGGEDVAIDGEGFASGDGGFVGAGDDEATGAAEFVFEEA